MPLSPPPPPTTTGDATVADVLAAAADAPTEVIVEVLRTRLDLGVVAINHALGIDASEFLRSGTRRIPAVVAAADQVWANVVAHPVDTTVPDLGTAWQSAAACRGKDPALWFCDIVDEDDPSKSSWEATDDEIEAVAVCTGCPVIGHCALSAINEPKGLWAGMTDRNRQRLRRYLRRGVVPVDPAAVGPLAVDISTSSLKARIDSRPDPYTDDGRLFAISTSEVPVHLRHRRRAPQRPVVEPLFA